MKLKNEEAITAIFIVLFSGESREEAIVSHLGLDIEEEDLFFAYIANMGYTIDDNDEIIDSLYKMWQSNNQTK